jgi:FkbM family methyltransferase
LGATGAAAKMTVPVRASRPLPLWQRLASRAVAAYPAVRGQTRLRKLAASWLIAELDFDLWVRVTGLVGAEWECLRGQKKEQKSTERVCASLRPGMTFVDVGANIGYFTLLAASRVGPAGRVLSFEPTPRVCQRLRENIQLNNLSNVVTVQKAIADQAGKARFFQSSEDPEENSLFRHETGADPVDVDIATLDDELWKHNIREVDLLKIDAEGAELAVLKGARALLSAPNRPAIVLEVNPVTLGQAGIDPQQVLNLLEQYGYVWEEIERFAWQGAVVTNIFATSRKPE